MFLLECRIVVSTAVVLFLWYKLRMLDSILKPYIESMLSRRMCLRVECSDLRLDIFNGRCEIFDATVFHPPYDEDSRWNFEYLAYAEKVSFSFDPVKSLYAFIRNQFKLLVFDRILVSSVDVYVEGYEETGKKTVLNLKLIGGEVPRYIRKRKPTMVEVRNKEREDRRRERERRALEKYTKPPVSRDSTRQSLQRNHRTEAISDPDTVVRKNSPRTTNSATDASGTRTSTLPLTELHSTSLSISHTPASPHYDGQGSSSVLQPSSGPSWASTASLFRSSITSKLQEWHAEVKDQGLMTTMKSKTALAFQATVSTVDAVYKSAKKHIGNSFQMRIAMLHERLRGGEPIAFPHEFLIQANAIILSDIEVNLWHALPPSLRQFEKRPLRVPEVSLRDVNGRQIMEFTVRPGAPPAVGITRVGPNTVGAHRYPTTSHAAAEINAGGTRDGGEGELPVRLVSSEDLRRHHGQLVRGDNGEVVPFDVVDPSLPIPLSTSTSEGNEEYIGGIEATWSDVGSEGEEFIADKNVPCAGPVSDRSIMHDELVMNSRTACISAIVESSAAEESAAVISSETTQSRRLSGNIGDKLNECGDSSTFHFNEIDIDEYAVKLLDELSDRVASSFWATLESVIKYSSDLGREEFSGIPLCVVLYKLERILLYELLKDNTGRLLQDAWSDFSSAFKLDDSDDSDEDDDKNFIAAQTHAQHPLFAVHL